MKASSFVPSKHADVLFVPLRALARAFVDSGASGVCVVVGVVLWHRVAPTTSAAVSAKALAAFQYLEYNTRVSHHAHERMELQLPGGV